MFCSIVLNLIT